MGAIVVSDRGGKIIFKPKKRYVPELYQQYLVVSDRGRKGISKQRKKRISSTSLSLIEEGKEARVHGMAMESITVTFSQKAFSQMIREESILQCDCVNFLQPGGSPKAIKLHMGCGTKYTAVHIYVEVPFVRGTYTPHRACRA